MTSLESLNWILLVSIHLLIDAVIGREPLKIKIEVGKELSRPTIGLLKSNLPALILNKIMSMEGTKTLITVFKASIHPTRYIHHIKTNPITYKNK